jgi:hypothetical protein
MADASVLACVRLRRLQLRGGSLDLAVPLVA